MRVQKGIMCGTVSSLLLYQHYQDRLYTVEKCLLDLAMETLTCNKWRNIGILNTRACPCYLPQAKDFKTKNANGHSQSQNNTVQNSQD